MQKYRPSKRTSLRGLLLLVLMTLLGGAAIGAIAALVAHYVYVIFLFPALVGALEGLLIVPVIERGDVHNPWLAGFFAILTGLIIYGTYRYGEYFDAQRQFYASARAEYSDETEAGAAYELDQYLFEETGSTGFVGFVLNDAKQGFAASRVGSSRSALTLSGAGAWLYWGFEGLVIVVIAVTAASGQAHHPYCEDCHRWYGKVRWIGSINQKPASEIMAAL